VLLEEEDMFSTSHKLPPFSSLISAQRPHLKSGALWRFDCQLGRREGGEDGRPICGPIEMFQIQIWDAFTVQT